MAANIYRESFAPLRRDEVQEYFPLRWFTVPLTTGGVRVFPDPAQLVRDIRCECRQIERNSEMNLRCKVGAR